MACAAILLAAACSRQAPAPPAVYVEQEIAPAPARVGPATITLKFAEPDSKPVIGAHVQVEADMTHAGMAPQFAQAKELGSGRYRADIEFSMAGDWVILLHATLPGGRKLERQIDVRGVRAN